MWLFHVARLSTSSQSTRPRSSAEARTREVQQSGARAYRHEAVEVHEVQGVQAAPAPDTGGRSGTWTRRSNPIKGKSAKEIKAKLCDLKKRKIFLVDLADVAIPPKKKKTKVAGTRASRPAASYSLRGEIFWRCHLVSAAYQTTG